MSTEMLWLEITGKCQLECTHCYADSGPKGKHTSMSFGDWDKVVGQAAEHGVKTIQVIGGEPTLWPGLISLIRCIRERAILVEVFSNLVHVTDDQWEAFSQPGVSLATSWYSDDPEEHREVTGRPSHARTLRNITKAVERGIPLRAGIIQIRDDQRCKAARRVLEQIGVPMITEDRIRALGRGRQPDESELCGHCGHGVAAIGPDGQVWPCVMSRWTTIGNVQDDSLDSILQRMPAGTPGMPAQDGCGPNCTPMANCVPWQSCSPKHN